MKEIGRILKVTVCHDLSEKKREFQIYLIKLGLQRRDIIGMNVVNLGLKSNS